MPLTFGRKSKPVIQSNPAIQAVVDDLDLADQSNVLGEDAPSPLRERFKSDPRIKAEFVERIAIDELKPNSKNAKKHPEHQISLLAENIEEFGFTNPLLIDENNKVLAGHARLEAAKRLGLEYLPVVRLTHLSPAQKRAVAIADNKLAELGAWDFEILAEEFEFLTDRNSDITFDHRITGFDTADIDQILDDRDEPDRHDPDDEVPPPASTPPVTEPGDLWEAGAHKLVCGDAIDPDVSRKLMGDELAQISFDDFPYNVPNAGHVTKREGVREFAMGKGEMSSAQFTEFLSKLCANILAYLASGAIVYTCMDWRHLRELQAAADPLFGSLYFHTLDRCRPFAPRPKLLMGRPGAA